MSMLPSFPKVYNLGHPAIVDLLDGPVLVEEKVDGSQFSFGLIDGELRFRSRSAEVIPGAAGMFDEGCKAIEGLPLHPGWVYRGEYLRKPKHNCLAYSRVPAQHVILFDIETPPYNFLLWWQKKAEAERLGFQTVPAIYEGSINTAEYLRGMLDRESVLGGAKIEGVVIKNYSRFGRDGKVLMGKHVSEAFKERASVEWKKQNPTKMDMVQSLIVALRSEARWQKAVQHLAECGVLTDTPADIGKLIHEVKGDVEAECADEIRDALFRWAWPHIHRGITRGLPEWYKAQLLEKQFEGKS